MFHAVFILFCLKLHHSNDHGNAAFHVGATNYKRVRSIPQPTCRKVTIADILFVNNKSCLTNMLKFL